VCPQLPLFADLSPAPAPNAERASEAVQVPVYAALTDRQVNHVANTVRRAVERRVRTGRAAPARS